MLLDQVGTEIGGSEVLGRDRQRPTCYRPAYTPPRRCRAALWRPLESYPACNTHLHLDPEKTHLLDPGPVLLQEELGPGLDGGHLAVEHHLVRQLKKLGLFWPKLEAGKWSQKQRAETRNNKIVYSWGSAIQWDWFLSSVITQFIMIH